MQISYGTKNDNFAKENVYLILSQVNIMFCLFRDISEKKNKIKTVLTFKICGKKRIKD